MVGTYLSKSKFLAGWQCPRRLWLEVHEPGKAEVPESTERAFRTGHQVGDIARRLFPDGILITHDDTLSRALEETRMRLSRPGPVTLFEATFRHQGVLVRTDILQRDEFDRVRLVEVKASTRVKPVNYIDCAVQTWVLAGAGQHPATVELAHINNQFVYAGDDDYAELLVFADLTDRIGAMLEQIPEWVEHYREVLAGDIPATRVGPQCRNPYDCSFLPFCTPPLPDYPIGLLPGDRKVVWELAEQGIDDIRDVPENRLTSEVQRWVRQVTIAGEADLRPGAADFLGKLSWPRYYFDFETVSFAVPIWAGTRPYQALPFQWSCHIESEDGSLSHRDWLADGEEPPMRSCAESLLEALGGEGPVFVYTSYEQGVLKDLAVMFPDLAPALERLIDRLVDLYPLTKTSYYHPEMRGSWSIKAVLPTIAPDMDYESLGEIREGTGASDAFLEILRPDTPEERRRHIRRDLLRYCEYDTRALVRVAAFLEGRP
ncbi:MAG: DUF2779 domain-containing protein [Gammaproteobacteria bacterium]|jgi:hypothetical protein